MYALMPGTAWVRGSSFLVNPSSNEDRTSSIFWDVRGIASCGSISNSRGTADQYWGGAFCDPFFNQWRILESAGFLPFQCSVQIVGKDFVRANSVSRNSFAEPF